MEEQLISFETAKLAKEKGFNTSNTGYRYDKKGDRIMDTPLDRLLWGTNYPIATQSLLQKWLREVHGIHIQVYTMERWLESGNDMETYFEVNLKTTHRLNGLSNIKFNMLTFKTYEEALENGLQKGLKLINNE